MDSKLFYSESERGVQITRRVTVAQMVKRTPSKQGTKLKSSRYQLASKLNYCADLK